MYIERQNALRTSVTLFVCGSQRTYLFLPRFDIHFTTYTFGRAKCICCKMYTRGNPGVHSKSFQLVIYVVIRLLGHCLYRQTNQKLSLALGLICFQVNSTVSRVSGTLLLYRVIVAFSSCNRVVLLAKDILPPQK